MKDITLVNLNMLYVRYASSVDRERHLPLGPLYLVRVLEEEGFEVDFRDYQTYEAEDPFATESFLRFFVDSADVVGLSVMANLLPFAILAIKALGERYPEKRVILGGVGPKSVEREICERFPWIDIIVRGESERSLPMLIRALKDGGDLSRVPGLTWRDGDRIAETPSPERIEHLDEIPFPAFHHVDLSKYEGYGMVTSRGCPYPCTFCSVAPVWDHVSKMRSNENIIEEMRHLKETAGVTLFLFQDEFFVSSPKRVRAFCRELIDAKLGVRFKAFGRVNLTDEETMRAMREAGCIEIRYGIESGSDRILERTKKGFTASEAIDVVARAVKIFPRVDAFYMWGFPFETMEDFHQTVFQMIAARSMGARVLPSLLCLLPQTELYEQVKGDVKLEFCRELFPEYMLTGHEVVRGGGVEVKPEHRPIFDFIEANPDIFPGFFHIDLEGNVRPKLKVLQELGFYPREETGQTDSCGAHSPRTEHRPQDIATR